MTFILKAGWQTAASGGYGRTAAKQTQAAYLMFGAIEWLPTISKRGGEVVGFQARKAAKTCNSLFLSDDTGMLLACSEPVAGNHHDMFEIEKVLGQLRELLKETGLQVEGLF